jgi:predicted nucleotidyltransferase
VAADLGVDRDDLAEFCRRWRIEELSLFGSALRADFDEDSDIDLLVAFDPEAEWSLLDHARMEEELEQLLGREVDLVTRRSVELSRNWIRRSTILETAEPLYAAG